MPRLRSFRAIVSSSMMVLWLRSAPSLRRCSWASLPGSSSTVEQAVTGSTAWCSAVPVVEAIVLSALKKKRELVRTYLDLIEEKGIGGLVLKSTRD